MTKHTQASQRQSALALMTDNPDKVWDMLIVGGGITGAGIAREAVRRGLSVLLVEQRDFAWGTSSRSSKMVHGGLRYMASGDVKTTMHSVRERERMLTEADGLVEEMHYVMPHYKGKFPPPWVFNNLLRVYDKLAGKRYLQYHKRDAFLAMGTGVDPDGFLGASQFSDAVTDDSRLVMRVLDEAVQDGAVAINYMQANGLLTDENGQVVGATLTDTANKDFSDVAVASDATVASGGLNDSKDSRGDAWQGADLPTFAVRAKVVVNATGAWADALRRDALQAGGDEADFRSQIRPSRGSHLVVSRERLPIDKAYTLLHPDDKRALFVYPWETRSVIGTTDLDHPPMDDGEVGITRAEVDYLLRAVNHLFADADLSDADIISTWAGVRPLISAGGDGERVNPSKEKRDHSVWLDHGLITVSGGKLTTFRLIALDVLRMCQQLIDFELDMADDTVFRTATPNDATFERLPSWLQHRLKGFYGKRLDALLVIAEPDEIDYVGETNTLWAELRYACRFEQVIHLDDLLLRRTRLGLLLAEGGLGEAFAPRIKAICQSELGWDEDKWQTEAERYRAIWHRFYFLPAK